MSTDRMVNEFIEMVKVSSLSLKEGRFASLLAKKLKALDFDVYVDRAGEVTGGDTGNVLGRLKGNPGTQPILLCAHMDTVVPGENINPVIHEGTIYSDGTTILGGDDKAGIAAILEAVRCIKENNIPHGDIEVAFTICEEGGMFGAKNMDYGWLRSKLAFVLDSGGNVGKVIVQAPAQFKILSIIKGKAAHAGVAPEKGISAIQAAARAIDRMKLLRIDEETTANVGSINGGSATNIVCDKVKIAMEARSLKRSKVDAQVNHMLECIDSACREYGAEHETEQYLSYPEFSIEMDSAAIKLVTAAMNRIGIKAVFESTGGGSDTNIMSEKGLQAVTLAIGMTNVHTTSECIAISNMEKTAELVAALIQEAR
ncbi:MAG: M20/M25/M40 family metallo-hydrolase [Clostridiaceae bacterium]|nr:M20/M25/M40 family metallo-hydrolase [Clostridiaceae bacterium]